jgi:hypothetical protein
MQPAGGENDEFIELSGARYLTFNEQLRISHHTLKVGTIVSRIVLLAEIP